MYQEWRTGETTMTDRLIDLQGVGPIHGATLAEHGLVTTHDLLTQGARPAGRAAIAKKSGISETLDSQGG